MMILCPLCNGTFMHIKRRVKGTMRERFMQQVFVAPNGCWLWMGGLGAGGYAHFNHGGKTLLAHRVSLEMKLGRPIKKTLHALHNCPDGDNPMCVNPDHLREGTHAENMREMFAKGRKRCFGENTRTAKLTETQVLQIRARANGALTNKELGIEYGVSRDAIYLILRGKTWKHLLPTP